MLNTFFTVWRATGVSESELPPTEKSVYVSPFKSKFGLTSYRENPLGSLLDILYTTRGGAVSGVTLKSNLYVFLACSVYGAKCSTDLLLLLSPF